MEAIESALDALEQYLRDEIPPERVARSVELLFPEPAESFVRRVGAWAMAESQAKSIAVSDFLLFALEKVYILGERDLVGRDALANFLDPVTTLVLRGCPPEERDSLRHRLTLVRMSGTKEATRPTVSTVAKAGGSRESAKAEKQLTLILERLGRTSAGEKKTSEAEAVEAAQILTMAAASSSSAEQFDELLSQIEKATGKKKGNVFATLGGGLPAWDLPIPSPGTKRTMPAQVGAMGKILELAETPAAALDRLRELVFAAVEKFNQGSLAAAMWMFDVAESGIHEKKIEPSLVDRIRDDAVNSLAAGQIRKYAENKSKHNALRLALEFFPTLRMEALFRQLRGEPRADRRRFLLGLIETHGKAARDRAIADLEAELARSDLDTWYLRNAIYLLHRIPRDSDETISRELAALAKSAAKGQNVYVIKEAATALGQIHTEGSVRILSTCLRETESLVLRNEASREPPGEMQKLIDRVVGSLARIATPEALDVVARHGARTSPLLGDTRTHLALLGEHDLSLLEGVVETLLKALREEIPGRFLGRLVAGKQAGTIRLLEALAGTESRELDEILDDLADRFENQELGQAAARIVEKRKGTRATAASEAVATLAGELEFFGIPTVLQSLSDMKATGVLTLTTKQGEVVARLVVSGGAFLDAQRDKLRGLDAFFEMIERPIAGRFAFVPWSPERIRSSAEPREILGLLFEAVRRQDELGMMTTLVPDDLILQATGVAPTAPEDETDPSLMREVWVKATSGAGVGQWRHEIAADSYRIRRFLAHWVESGALAGR